MVSIVMPVHNAADVLRGAIESVRAQTFTDFELLCVENGSTDSSPSIVEEVSRSDPRIRLIRYPIDDRGPGGPRNLGITQANGRYLAFLDSDDLFRPSMLERLVEKSARFDLDVSMCAIDTFSEDGEHSATCPYSNTIPVELDTGWFTATDLDEKIFQLRFVAWNKLYRTEFVRSMDLRFSPDRFYEDLMFTFPALLLADRIGFVREVLYLNRKERRGATTHDQGDRAYDALMSMQEFGDFLQDQELSHLLGAYQAFRFRKLKNYLPHNDTAHVHAFFEHLKALANSLPVEAEAYLNGTDRQALARIREDDLESYLLWSLWAIHLRNQRSQRRMVLLKAKTQRQRDRIERLEAERAELRQRARHPLRSLVEKSQRRAKARIDRAKRRWSGNHD